MFFQKSDSDTCHDLRFRIYLHSTLAAFLETNMAWPAGRGNPSPPEIFFVSTPIARNQRQEEPWPETAMLLTEIVMFHHDKS